MMKTIGLFLMMASFSLNVWGYEKSFEDFKKAYKPSDVKLYDRNNLILETIRTDPDSRSLSWTSIHETSYAFKRFLILSEDKNFYEHKGVDVKSLLKAAWDRLSDSGSKRGASTITMQLMNILHPELKGIKKGLSEKFDQIKLALDLEKRWSKDQILEAYINSVPFKGELVGIRAASFGLFNKAPGALNDREAAILVALIRSPNAKADMVALRACMLLDDKSCQAIYTKTIQLFSKSYSIERTKKLVSIVDESFVMKKTQESGDVYTTLDLSIQKTAIDSLHEQIKSLKDQNLSDGAILVLNNHTDEVMAYVPNGGEQYSSSPRFDNIRGRRQAGSTLKPFIYAKAIDEKLLTPTSLVDDSPVDIPIGHGALYFPRNYDNSFHGLVTAGAALGSSLNVPAVKTLMLVGGEKVIVMLKKLGFKKLESADFYGPSLALGSVDVSLWDLTRAYQRLLTGNDFSKATRSQVFDMLSNPENRRLTFGVDSVLTFPFNVAVKTGTSKDMRDNWCVGFSRNYTVGVWVGNSSGKPMWNVSGITGAAPIFRSVMLALEKDTAKRSSLFLQAGATAVKIDEKKITKIRYPVNGEVIGFDLEIPEHLQKMPIEVENRKENHVVMVDGKTVVGDFWSVEKGQHVLTLNDGSGDSLETIKFEVR